MVTPGFRGGAGGRKPFKKNFPPEGFYRGGRFIRTPWNPTTELFFFSLHGRRTSEKHFCGIKRIKYLAALVIERNV